MTTNPQPEPLPGDDYWSAFETLRQDLLGLHLDWQLHEQLYGFDQARVDLLNASAGSFFHRVFWIMVRDTTIGILRLLDRPVMLGKQNLVLESLVDDLDKRLYASSKHELSEKLESIRKKAEVLKRFRHKRVAHRDRLTAEGTMRSPEISRGLFTSVLEGMGDYLNEISVRFRRPNLVLDVMVPGDGLSLVGALQQANAFRVLLDDGTIPRDSIRKTRHPEAGCI